MSREVATAVITEQERLSWDQLDALRDRIELRRVLVAEPEIETIAAVAAAFARGASIALLHPRLTVAEAAEQTRLAKAALAAPEPVIVLFTSGSSGQPRPVALPHRAFIASAAASAANLGWQPRDCWLCALPLAHVGGLSIVTRSLRARRTIALAPPPFEPEQVLARIQRDRVTLISLVPTMLAGLLDAGWAAPTTVRAVLLGGAPAPTSLLERAGAASLPILTTYGMTETCAQVCTQPYPERGIVCGNAGLPLPGVELDTTGERIRIRGPMLALDVADADGWLTTADRGRQDHRGRLTLFGRADDLIITGGENVDPREVEAALLTCPHLAAACVVPLPDPRWGQRVAAAIVPSPGTTIDLATLDHHLRPRLARFKHPRQWRILEALPLLPTGKIDRQAIIALLRDKPAATR